MKRINSNKETLQDIKKWIQDLEVNIRREVNCITVWFSFISRYDLFYCSLYAVCKQIIKISYYIFSLICIKL